MNAKNVRRFMALLISAGILASATVSANDGSLSTIRTRIFISLEISLLSCNYINCDLYNAASAIA